MVRMLKKMYQLTSWILYMQQNKETIENHKKTLLRIADDSAESRAPLYESTAFSCCGLKGVAASKTS